MANGLRRWGVLCLVLMGRVLSAHAGTAAVPSPPVASSAEERTRALLEKHCASCHDEAKARPGDAAPALGNILDLDAVAREPTLVEPRRADASRLYQVLLTRHAPLEIARNGNGPPAPSAEDIDAVRDWIERLPPRPQGCPERPRASDSEVISLIEQWRIQLGAAARDAGFVSLAHLSNACLGEAELAGHRNAVTSAIAALGDRPDFSALTVIGDLNVVLAFRLSEAGLTPEAWAAILAEAPRRTGDAVPADWLAHRAGTIAAIKLARRYREDVGLLRAAAEMGLEEDALAARLEETTGPTARIAKQLRQGLVSRARWEWLAKVLSTGREFGSPPADEPPPLRLALWSDKTTYKAGDLASLTAASNSDCHLTLIGIDRAGTATVLFPNEFEPDNFLRGGTSITIPVRSATYQLRVKEPGSEHVVGICSARRQRPEGIAHDFGRERFTVLGNWRAFLLTAGEFEKQYARTEGVRSGRTLGKSTNAAAARSRGEARTSITFTVK